MSPLGKLGDVAPFPDGNKSVDIADWVQVGRFVAGLDTPPNPSEAVRAHCAPGINRGLNIQDWTECARFAAGLDPVQPVGSLGRSLLLTRLPVPSPSCAQEPAPGHV